MKSNALLGQQSVLLSGTSRMFKKISIMNWNSRVFVPQLIDLENFHLKNDVDITCYIGAFLSSVKIVVDFSTYRHDGEDSRAGGMAIRLRSSISYTQCKIPESIAFTVDIYIYHADGSLRVIVMYYSSRSFLSQKKRQLLTSNFLNLHHCGK